MTLRDQLNPEESNPTTGDARDSDEKITIYLTDKSSWIEVQAYHDKVFKFLRNAVDIFADVADQVECDIWEKACLLNDWLDTLKDVKDRWFKEFEDRANDDESD